MDQFQQIDHAEHAANGPCPDCGGPQADGVHLDTCPRELAELARRDLAVKLQTMTPAEVDTLAAPLEQDAAELWARQWHHQADARKARRSGGPFAINRIERAERAAEELGPKIKAAETAATPYRVEFTRRGGWPRIFWCTANGGHAHRSTSCRTLHIGTGMVWLPELSGTEEAALVELAGESACTICYPSAPVEAREKPSQLRPAVEEREAKAARAREAAERKAAKDAKALTMPDGSPVKHDGHEARTVVSGWREGAGALASLLWYSADHPSAAAWRRFAEMAAEALAHKLDRTPEDVMAELQAKAEAKHKRDRRGCAPPTSGPPPTPREAGPTRSRDTHAQVVPCTR